MLPIGNFLALPLGRPPDRDDKHAIGYSSPRINEDVDEHHLIIFMGTRTPFSLLHCSQAQRSWMLSFDTFITSNRTREARLRQLVGSRDIEYPGRDFSVVVFGQGTR